MSDLFEGGATDRDYSVTEQLSMQWLRRMYALDIWKVVLTYPTDSSAVFLPGQISDQLKENSPGSFISRQAVEAEIGIFVGQGMVRQVIPPPKGLPRNAKAYQPIESPKWEGVRAFVEAIELPI